jgi:hypothetical protein
MPLHSDTSRPVASLTNTLADLIVERPSLAPGTTDCNGNGVPDPFDILDGTAEDRNHDGVPDGCDADGWISGDDELLREIKSQPMSVTVSRDPLPFDIRCDCPRRGRFSLLVRRDSTLVISTLFHGTLDPGRYIFYWMPRRHGVPDSAAVYTVELRGSHAIARQSFYGSGLPRPRNGVLNN